MTDAELTPSQDSAVDHPSHYNFGRYEVIDVIADWKLDFDLGSAVKYIARAGRKDSRREIEDLRKAVTVIQHKIKVLEDAQ